MRVAVISLHVNWKSTWRISSISQHTTPATTSQVGERTHPHQEAENRYSNPLLDLFRQHGTLKQNKQQKAEVFREMLGHDPQQKFRKNASGKILGWFRPGVDFSRHPFFPKFQHACPEHSVSSLQIRQMIFFYPRFSEWLFNREATKGSREGIYEIKISCSPLGFFPPQELFEISTSTGWSKHWRWQRRPLQNHRDGFFTVFSSISTSPVLGRHPSLIIFFI